MNHFIGYNPTKIAITPYQQALCALFSGFETGAIHPYTALQITGTLDVERLCSAAQTVMQKNDALRSFIRLEENGPEIYVYERADFSPEIMDCESDDAVCADINTMLNRPYTAQDDCLFHMKLYRLPQSRYIFFFMISHIVSDGESIGAFVKKMLSTYADGQYSDAETTHSMAEYNQEELRFYASEDFRKNYAYWNQRVKFDYPQYLEPRFPEFADEPEAPFFMIPMQQIRECLAKYRCTSNLFITAVYHLTLCRVLKQAESSFFFMYGNRTKPEYADLIAPQFQIIFSKLQADASQSCGDLVRSVIGQFMEGMEYAHGCLLSFPLQEAIASGGLGSIMTYNRMPPETQFGDLTISNYNVMFNSMENTVLPCNLLMIGCSETPDAVLICPILAVNDKIDKKLFLREFSAVFKDTAKRLAVRQETEPFFEPQELQTKGE